MCGKEFKTLLKVLTTILEVCILLGAGKERQGGSVLDLSDDPFHLE